MQTLLTSSQMRLADAFTIANEPISSISLMERAVQAFVANFIKEVIDLNEQIAVFCGKGNNGGDGLGIARVLINCGYCNVKAYIVNFGDKQSDDFSENLKQLEQTGCDIITISHATDANGVMADTVIDAILGSGLNKPLTGEYAALIEIMNAFPARIYAVDVPTGFPSEGIIVKNYNGIEAFKTICFQRPKINFFFPESAAATERYEVVNIGLNEAFIESQDSDIHLLEDQDIRKILKPRKNFSHKGIYGHALIIAGSTNTMGAAILSSMACLNAGAGLTTACIPNSGLVTLNSVLPEVMALPRDEYTRIENTSKYHSIAIGCGLGISSENAKLLESLIAARQPLVIDADALNILGENPELIKQLPQHSILTPHMKEFDRLFGFHQEWWSRVQTAKAKAKELQIVIVLKNQYTFICAPDGSIFINPTGNPAMAQGGMGDVLTGVIAAFVAQNYTSVEAAILACYVHGKSGDVLASEHFVISATKLAENVSRTIRHLL
ncbi:bifunctional ADP-dependent NAD(P)H-hydrate dehydratase/NAD(P)H-hydrate epimerase [Pedobacter sp. BMA]|uniref:bifunctional ADP-dependent NAD(P)H-hydrate dehydratase/NAD(P)H-hydrate epimerase n=1 Tax=Pedobacter sp. BMA TaxID=1663685 RepID=UPI00064B12BF|nr:bifunctional ADP-dependent NAD(P)H-hydrate dehydratase/NAD(P)H-hydrate epimerase [Pedobacter sp. BMA]KLT65170.1 carbohydrate kinase [Pedobacter sp. BMA]